MLKLHYYPLLLLVLFTSCRHGAEEVKPVEPPAIVRVFDPIDHLLLTAQLSPTAEEYISGTFDGYPLYCATDKYPGQSGVFHLNAATSIDYGDLSRQNPREDIQLHVGFVNTNLFQRALPASWPHPNSVFCEGISVELRVVAADNTQLYFIGSSGYGTPLFVTITSIADGIIEGIFQGALIQQGQNGQYIASDVVAVKNGKFRIKTHTLSY